MAAGGALAVADDVLLEIFARVRDPVDLLRCVGACRRWLRLIAADDPCFLLLRRAAGLSPPPEKKRKKEPAPPTFILGAFYQNAVLVSASAALDKTRKNRLIYPPQFARLVHSPRLMPDCCSLFPNDDGVLGYAKPLASRRGLLLARVMPTPLDRRKLHLALCHPLIGHRRLVPPPPLLDLDPSLFGAELAGYALLLADHHRHLHSPEFQFQVLIIAASVQDREQDKPVHCAYCYSSATSTWRSAPIARTIDGLTTMSGPRAGVVDAHGTAHWLYRDDTSFYSLGITITAGDVPAAASLTKIPIQVEPRLRPPFPCVSKGGNLCLANVRPKGVLQLWTKRDGSQGGGWARSELICDDQARGVSLTTMAILGFAESRGALLVQHGHLFVLDLESKEMELVGGHDSGFGWRPLCASSFRCRGYHSCDQCAYNASVLYEMDWPSYLHHLCHLHPRN